MFVNPSPWPSTRPLREPNLLLARRDKFAKLQTSMCEDCKMIVLKCIPVFPLRERTVRSVGIVKYRDCRESWRFPGLSSSWRATSGFDWGLTNWRGSTMTRPAIAIEKPDTRLELGLWNAFRYCKMHVRLLWAAEISIDSSRISRFTGGSSTTVLRPSAHDIVSRSTRSLAPSPKNTRGL